MKKVTLKYVYWLCFLCMPMMAVLSYMTGNNFLMFGYIITFFVLSWITADIYERLGYDKI